MNVEIRKFIDDQLFSLTVMATLQRSKTYQDGARQKAKADFRTALGQLLVELSKKYRQKVKESEHIKNIEYLATELSYKFGEVLHERRFRIGSAQKALNLYLKYLWCTDQIPMPPHCPFDNDIISNLSGFKGIKWTELDDISQYKSIVTDARRQAANEPLAQWELRTYNTIRSKRTSRKRCR